MTLLELSGYLLSIAMGLSLGLIGGGGSILTVPILVYFFRQDGVTATASSLFVVGSTALLGALINAKRKLINFKVGVTFAIPSFVGVFLVRKVVLPWIPDSMVITESLLISKSLLILVSFSVIMILASRAMILSGSKSPATEESNGEPQLSSVIAKGFLVGCTTGFVGAGGGFLIIPALVLLLKVPMRMAVGTSLGIIAANSLFGFTLSLGTQSVDWPLLSKITLLGLGGLIAGSFFSAKINERKLKKGFGYFVLLIGSLVLLDQILRMTKGQ